MSTEMSYSCRRDRRQTDRNSIQLQNESCPFQGRPLPKSLAYQLQLAKSVGKAERRKAINPVSHFTYNKDINFPSKQVLQSSNTLQLPTYKSHFIISFNWITDRSS